MLTYDGKPDFAARFNYLVLKEYIIIIKLILQLKHLVVISS